MSPDQPVTLLATATAAALAAAAAALSLSHPAGGRVSSGPRGVRDGPRTSPDRAAPPNRQGPPAQPGVLRFAATLAAGTAAWAFVPGGWGAAAAAAAALLTWRRSRSWEPASVRRRRLRLEAELPWVVDLLTAALRVGLGPAEALERVAEVSDPAVRQELQVPLARLRLGADPVRVWSDLAGHLELGGLGVALRRASESGAPVVDALERLGADLRAQQRAAVEVRIRRIEVKAAVPLGLCLLPAFVLLAVVPLVAGSASRLLGG